MWRTQGRRYIDKMKTENALRRSAIADEVGKAMRLRRSLATREKALENKVDERNVRMTKEVQDLRKRLQTDERQFNRSATPSAVKAAATSVAKASAHIPSKKFKALDMKLKTLLTQKQLLDAELLAQVSDYAASYGMDFHDVASLREMRQQGQDDVERLKEERGLRKAAHAQDEMAVQRLVLSESKLEREEIVKSVTDAEHAIVEGKAVSKHMASSAVSVGSGKYNVDGRDTDDSNAEAG
jgi:hypothetical protein